MRALLLCSVVSIAACDTPCEALQGRAETCGTVPGSDDSSETAVCTAAKGVVEKGAFAELASCVSDTDCDDTGAVDACVTAALPEDAGACDRFTVWAAACGLTPADTSDDCTALSNTVAGGGFDRWVECVTVGGCPTVNDDRYARCQSEILPPVAQNLIDACTQVAAWQEACAGIALPLPTDIGGGFAGCIAQSELFTTESYLTYGTCLSEVECDDTTGRILCYLELEFINVRDEQEACAELVEFSATCDSPLGGESEDVCVRIFARFTAESVESFVGCVKEQSCGDEAAYANCSLLLELSNE